MKLYIWEGDGISGAYHDDGTLVVLADSPEHAREVVREAWRTNEEARLKFDEDRAALWASMGLVDHDPLNPFRGMTVEQRQQDNRWFNENYQKGEVLAPDGSREAIDREPDRVVEIDTPCIVAFNGGGYD